jgi:hypothetical protein
MSPKVLSVLRQGDDGVEAISNHAELNGDRDPVKASMQRYGVSISITVQKA